MDKNLKRLCSICVRGGSKGLPEKNIRELKGKPLFVHSIDQAKKSGLFDFIVISSDSEKILNIAHNYGADLTIKRPANLANDHSPKLPAIQHCLHHSEEKLKIKFDIIIDLDATSPLRSIKDINGVINLLENSPFSINIITGSVSRRSPYFNLVEVDENGFVYLSGIKKKWREMIVYKEERIEKSLKILNKNNQIVFVLDKDEKLIGTVTDRDIKKGLLKGFSLENCITDIMNKFPTVIYEETGEEEIYKIFEEKNYLHLPVIDKNYRLINVKSLKSFVRRQDTPKSFDLNASIYAWWRTSLVKSKNVITEKTRLYEMPEERSIDIDTELDFKWVNFLMTNIE